MGLQGPPSPKQYFDHFFPASGCQQLPGNCRIKFTLLTLLCKALFNLRSTDLAGPISSCSVTLVHWLTLHTALPGHFWPGSTSLSSARLVLSRATQAKTRCVSDHAQSEGPFFWLAVAATTTVSLPSCLHVSWPPLPVLRSGWPLYYFPRQSKAQ